MIGKLRLRFLGSLRLLTGAALLLAAVACGKSTSETTVQTCEPRIPSSGRPQKIPDPVHPSSCYVVGLMCNYCSYKADGTFESSGFEPCGVCLQKGVP